MENYLESKKLSIKNATGSWVEKKIKKTTNFANHRELTCQPIPVDDDIISFSDWSKNALKNQYYPEKSFGVVTS